DGVLRDDGARAQRCSRVQFQSPFETLQTYQARVDEHGERVAWRIVELTGYSGRVRGERLHRVASVLGDRMQTVHGPSDDGRVVVVPDPEPPELGAKPHLPLRSTSRCDLRLKCLEGFHPLVVLNPNVSPRVCEGTNQ